MKIGYACLTVGTNNIPSYKTCTIKKYNKQVIKEIISHNLNTLLLVLEYNKVNNIKMFRISSGIIPLASHPINEFDWKKEFETELLKIGEFIKSNQMRVSMHPGQYTILNSVNEDVVRRAVLDLTYHADFLDSLSVDSTNKIILHIGGVYDDKSLAIKRFITNYQKLSTRIKARLVIENDDRLYNINDVLEISMQTSIPVVFDNLHHKINKSELFSELEWIKMCKETWTKEDGNAKLHYSNQNPNKRIGAHSEFIFIEKFLDFYDMTKKLNVDVMLEVKDKNLSAIKCIHCTNFISLSSIQSEWAKYKYVILEKDHNTYKKIREYLKNYEEFESKIFYLYIERALSLENTRGGYRNSFDHVWGYFKNICTEKEKSLYLKKLDAFNKNELKASSMKKFLYKLATQYDVSYLIDSYYFHF